jgi:hypothetical protein
VRAGGALTFDKIGHIMIPGTLSSRRPPRGQSPLNRYGPWHWAAATIETIRTTLRYLGRAPPAHTVLLRGLLLVYGQIWRA